MQRTFPIALFVPLMLSIGSCERSSYGPDGAAVTTSTDDPCDPEGALSVSRPQVVIDCGDALEEVYLTPDRLPAFNDSERGRIVRCAPLERRTREEVSASLASLDGLHVRSGYEAFLLSYRTERDPGAHGLGTARLFVPDTPLDGPLPVVVVAHGTAGLADACAPSQLPSPQDGELLFPWVGQGLPVIAPDYTGLGTAGVQGYSNNIDQGHSVLDAARAARRALVCGSTDGRTIVVGHSQGGGAAIAARAYADSYGLPEVNLIGAVAFAPGMTTENMTEAVQNAAMVRFEEGGMRAIFAMMFFADFSNLYGRSNASEFFAPSLRDFVVDAVSSQCIHELIPTLDNDHDGYQTPTTLGDLLHVGFQMAVGSCQINAPGCTPHAEAFIKRSEDNALHFSEGGPTLILTGSEDAMVPPSRQACVRDLLTSSQVELQTCMAEGADHMSIISLRTTFAVEWVGALVDGADLPTCPEGPNLPDCERYR